MAFDDSATQGAITKYMKSIRPEAPYLPSNIEYIAKNNGLEGGSEEVRSVIFSASYMVMGLGDVYLGAPCAVPLDPRHRLVTTKYNPARTFTEEGTVGIGGSYMCIYPMDSPGGYQLVGRTLPIWNTFARAGPFTPDKPWLLRNFDQVQFFQVSEEELLDAREKFATGRYTLDIQDSEFNMASYHQFCEGLKEEVATIKVRQRAAMDTQLVAEAESLARLQEAAANGTSNGTAPVEDEDDDSKWQGDEYVRVTAPFTANVWSISVEAGEPVNKDDVLLVLEAMKMETPITSPCSGHIAAVRVTQSQLAPAGALMVVIKPDA